MRKLFVSRKISCETWELLIIFYRPNGCNGIALWVDWQIDLSDKNLISTGPLLHPTIGKPVVWDVHNRQGVYLFQNMKQNVVHYNFTFNSSHGNILFTCT